MKTPHSFTPHRLAAAVVLALSGPSALAAVDCTVSASSDDGTGNTPNTLSWAITTANTTTTTATGHTGGGCTNNTITLATDVSLTGVMQRLIDSDMTLDGQSHTIDGGGFRPLFVKSGAVTIKNMVISNGLAQGGASSGGGGGAGLGGALFVYSGMVTVKDVTFSANKALGGQNSPIDFLYSGGGGMFGNSALGGGGLFGDGNGWAGGYGGTSSYNSTNLTFGAGGNSVNAFYGTPAADGGFGGGGGTGGSFGDGGNGGFGGGGGYNASSAGDGGFGGGGGGGLTTNGGYGGGDSGNDSTGGSGAGFGGAIFVMRGELTLHNVNFSSNDATGGAGTNPGEGRGGAVFICTANLTDSGTNQAPTQCGGSINATSCGVIANDTASTDQKELFWKGANGNIEFSAIGATQACPVTPTGPTSPIPTLSEWGLLLMSSLLGLFGAWRTRKVAGSRTKRRT